MTNYDNDDMFTKLEFHENQPTRGKGTSAELPTQEASKQ